MLDFVPGVLIRPRFGLADESQFSIRGSGLQNNLLLRHVGRRPPIRLAAAGPHVDDVDPRPRTHGRRSPGARRHRVGGIDGGAAPHPAPLHGRRRPPLSPIHTLSTAVKAWEPDIAIARDGSFVVAWHEEQFPRVKTRPGGDRTRPASRAARRRRRTLGGVAPLVAHLAERTDRRDVLRRRFEAGAHRVDRQVARAQPAPRLDARRHSSLPSP